MVFVDFSIIYYATLHNLINCIYYILLLLLLIGLGVQYNIILNRISCTTLATGIYYIIFNNSDYSVLIVNINYRLVTAVGDLRRSDHKFSNFSKPICHKDTISVGSFGQHVVYQIERIILFFNYS